MLTPRNPPGWDDKVEETGKFTYSSYLEPYPNGKDQLAYWLSNGKLGPILPRIKGSC